MLTIYFRYVAGGFTQRRRPSVCLSVRLLVCRQRAVVGHWLTGARVLLLAASRVQAAGTIMGDSDVSSPSKIPSFIKFI